MDVALRSATGYGTTGAAGWDSNKNAKTLFPGARTKILMGGKTHTKPFWSHLDPNQYRLISKIIEGLNCTLVLEEKLNHNLVLSIS